MSGRLTAPRVAMFWAVTGPSCTSGQGTLPSQSPAAETSPLPATQAVSDLRDWSGGRLVGRAASETSGRDLLFETGHAAREVVHQLAILPQRADLVRQAGHLRGELVDAGVELIDAGSQVGLHFVDA